MKKLEKGDIAKQIDSLYKSQMQIINKGVRYTMWFSAFQTRVNLRVLINTTDPEFLD